jgi:proteic killer suppression protein
LTSVKLQATVYQVKIRNFVHKGLKRLYAEDIVKGVPTDTVDKLRKMLAFLDDMQDPEELRSWRGRCTR